MPEMSRLTLRPDPATVVAFGTGGDARTRSAWIDGKRSDQAVQREGAEVRRLSGLAVSIGGVGLDGATVETLTPLDAVPAGTIFRAEGVVEVSVRAEGRPGYGDDAAPRGVLAVTVFIERLAAVATAADLVAAQSASAPAKRGGA